MYNYNREALLNHFDEILQRSIGPEARNWLSEKLNRIRNGDVQALFQAFTSAPRNTGKALILPDENDVKNIAGILPGFTLSGYTADRLARVMMLMSFPIEAKETYLKNISSLFKAAEMNELVALYGALPLLAYPGEWVAQCTEGIRSNIGSVLEAIMCDNLYPAHYLPEAAWNQLVLKAFFTEKPIGKIIGIDERANKALAYTLVDYAHERWAAHRTFDPQLWRLTAKFIDEKIYRDIYKVIREGSVQEKAAAALACAQSNYKPAKALLDETPALKSAVRNGLSWDNLGYNLEQQENT